MVFDKDKARRMIDATMDRNAELAGQLEQANNDLTRLRAELEAETRERVRVSGLAYEARDAAVKHGLEANELRSKLAAAEAARDEARALIPIVCCNGADPNCYGPRGCLVRAQEANVTEKDVLIQARDTHKARADAACHHLRDVVRRVAGSRKGYCGDHHVFTPQIEEAALDRWQAFLASPGATTEAEQARGGESSPSEGGAR